MLVFERSYSIPTNKCVSCVDVAVCVPKTVVEWFNLNPSVIYDGRLLSL